MTDLEKAMLEFDEIINRPSHYNTGEIEVWDFIIDQDVWCLMWYHCDKTESLSKDGDGSYYNYGNHPFGFLHTTRTKLYYP